MIDIKSAAAPILWCNQCGSFIFSRSIFTIEMDEGRHTAWEVSIQITTKTNDHNSEVYYIHGEWSQRLDLAGGSVRRLGFKFRIFGKSEKLDELKLRKSLGNKDWTWATLEECFRLFTYLILAVNAEGDAVRSFGGSELFGEDKICRTKLFSCP